MAISPTLADLMADPGELDVSCLDCRHNTTVPVAALLPAASCGTRLYRSELYQIIAAVVVSPSGWRGALALELAGSLRVAGRPEPEPVTVSRARAGVRLFEQSDVGTARPWPRCTVPAVAMVVLDGIKDTGQAGLHDGNRFGPRTHDAVHPPQPCPDPVGPGAAARRLDPHRSAVDRACRPAGPADAGDRLRPDRPRHPRRRPSAAPGRTGHTRPHCRTAGGSAAPCDRRGPGSRRHCAPARRRRPGNPSRGGSAGQKAFLNLRHKINLPPPASFSARRWATRRERYSMSMPEEPRSVIPPLAT